MGWDGIERKIQLFGGPQESSPPISPPSVAFSRICQAWLVHQGTGMNLACSLTGSSCLSASLLLQEAFCLKSVL